MAYDPKYKMKHRLPRVSRLLKYADLPPPMVGDPGRYEYDEVRGVGWRSWEQREKALYEYAMALKRGVVPIQERRGIWLWQ